MPSDVLAYYSTVIFKESVHMSNHLALLMGGFVSMAFMCGTLVAFPLVDRVGRRRVRGPNPFVKLSFTDGHHSS